MIVDGTIYVPASADADSDPVPLLDSEDVLDFLFGEGRTDA